MSKQVIVFIDGQNLYHLARVAWASLPTADYRFSYPSYDVKRLASTLVARESGRDLKQVRFYTGVPDQFQDPHWNGFWNNKLRFLKSQGIHIYRGRINPGGQEKGVDVSLAIDLIQLTHEKAYDVALIVSHDRDFGPAVKLAKKIAASQQRFLDFESAFPYEPEDTDKPRPPRGIPGTRWQTIDMPTYASCFDPIDYRQFKHTP